MYGYAGPEGSNKRKTSEQYRQHRGRSRSEAELKQENPVDVIFNQRQTGSWLRFLQREGWFKDGRRTPENWCRNQLSCSDQLQSAELQTDGNQRERSEQHKYGQGVNSTASDREGMEIRATEGLESYKQWKIKFRAKCRTALALSALLQSLEQRNCNQGRYQGTEKQHCTRVRQYDQPEPGANGVKADREIRDQSSQRLESQVASA